MSFPKLLQRPLLIIVIGLVVIAATYMFFNARYNGIAPTIEELDRTVATGSRQDVLKLIKRSEQAGTISKSAMVIIGVEMVVTIGWAVLEARQKSPTDQETKPISNTP